MNSELANHGYTNEIFIENPNMESMHDGYHLARAMEDLIQTFIDVDGINEDNAIAWHAFTRTFFETLDNCHRKACSKMQHINEENYRPLAGKPYPDKESGITQNEWQFHKKLLFQAIHRDRQEQARPSID